MLELYQAYTDYHGMMDLCERLIQAAAKKLETSLPPFRRAGLFELLKEHTGLDLREALSKGGIRDAARGLGVTFPDNAPDKNILDHIFDEKVVPKLNDPTFVTDYPAAFSPLAKRKPGDPEIVERFELYLNGMECANAYSELNDPQLQKVIFEEQMEAKRKGDAEAQSYDADYIVALEHGLPPTGGLGIGIDRLVMVLTKTDSIREVVLFPLLRPE